MKYQVVLSELPKVFDEKGNAVEDANVNVSFSTAPIDTFNNSENYINGVTAKISINGEIHEAEIVRRSNTA